MSELRIDPDIGADLECEVGDVLTITLTGTVTTKTPDGGKTLNVTEIADYEHAGEPYADEAVEATPPATPPMRPKDKSAVMIMVGKGK